MTIDIIIPNDAKIIDHGIATVIFLNCFSVYLAYANESSVLDVSALARQMSCTILVHPNRNRGLGISLGGTNTPNTPNS
uniref:Uncharacterized protein n=1 Tax=Tanacetum cinerariifolium TaxID=118510 RepID=A0A6L2MYF6_TANCI|nr:hypothetical protein [Tanacetum cinerariifolium]